MANTAASSSRAATSAKSIDSLSSVVPSTWMAAKAAGQVRGG